VNHPIGRPDGQARNKGPEISALNFLAKVFLLRPETGLSGNALKHTRVAADSKKRVIQVFLETL
jgi:hypothetical protein